MRVDRLKTKSLFKILLVYLTALSLVKVFSLETILTILSNYIVGLIATVWIVVPSVILVFQRRKFKAYSISLSGWKQSLKIMLMACLSIMTTKNLRRD